MNQNTRRHNVWKPVTKRDTASRSLVRHRQNAEKIGVRAYARELQIKPGTLSRYLTGDWTPKSAIICKALDIPLLALGIVCPVHGKVCAVQHRPSSDKPKRPRPGWGRKPLNVVWPENTIEW